MRVYTYSEARQNLAQLLTCAERGKVIIKRRDGKTFVVVAKPLPASPFDVPSLDVQVSTQAILEAVSTSRRSSADTDAQEKLEKSMKEKARSK